jgi:predicted transcriptional regulator
MRRKQEDIKQAIIRGIESMESGKMFTLMDLAKKANVNWTTLKTNLLQMEIDGTLPLKVVNSVSNKQKYWIKQ